MTFTRRALLEGAGALSAQLLLSRRLQAHTSAQANPGKLTGPPRVLNLTLTSLSPNIPRISISPANDAPRLGELGMVIEEGKDIAGPGQVHPGRIPWGCTR